MSARVLALATALALAPQAAEARVHGRRAHHATKAPATRPQEKQAQEKSAQEKSAQVKSDAPLAKPRGVQAAVWVAGSRFHDEAPERATIVVERAMLYVRPSTSTAPVATAARGEIVDVVRKSVDGKWCLVHPSGGDVAWVELASLGAAPRPAIDPPLPPSNAIAPARSTFASSSLTSSSIAPSSLTSSSFAPTSTSASPSSPASSDATVVVAAPEPLPPRHQLSIEARAGLAMLAQRLQSNGTRPLSGFDLSTDGVAAELALRYEHAPGRVLRIAADAGYTFAGATGVRAPATDGNVHTLAMQRHAATAGVAIGLHGRALGGAELSLRAGGVVQLELVDADPAAPVASEQIFALSIGAQLALPRLFTIAGRPFGLRAQGAAFAPAVRVQAAGLADGGAQTTYGFAFGGGATFVLASSARRGTLTLVADYQYAAFLSRFTGAPASCSFGAGCSTVANRGSLAQLVTLGLGWAR